MIVNILICIATVAVFIFMIHDIIEMYRWLNDKNNDDDKFWDD